MVGISDGCVMGTPFFVVGLLGRFADKAGIWGEVRQLRVIRAAAS
jgi:hypothetical protein